MKVLLVGEYSALHKNLAEGLRELNHYVIVASSGDGKKQISMDWNIQIGKRTPFKSLFRILYLLIFARGFDVVQFINPIIFPIKFGLNELLIKFLIKHNKKSYLVAAGTDFKYIMSCSNFRYNPVDSLFKCSEGKYLKENMKYLERWNSLMLRYIDGVIPVMYEYAVGYRNTSKCCKTIPLPVNIGKVKLSNKNNNKIVIVYGRTRPGFKGEKYILPALTRINKEYSSVDVRILENLPNDAYIRELESSDIIVDQCRSYSYGMNALFGLALGKVVLSGNEPECEKEFGHSVPIINILPNEDDIYNKIKKILDEYRIDMISKDSRIFVEKFHDSKIVASQYINVWY